MYMTSNAIQTGSNIHNIELVSNNTTIPTAGANSNDYGYRKSSHHANSDVERFLPELLVMEIHRDGNAVTYRHYTIRGLYRYVLDAIADRTGILQATAYTQVWKNKTKEIVQKEIGRAHV